jgi:hypothetical protein
MLRDEDCPHCDYEFEVEEWVGGSCPNCGKKYIWDEASFVDEEGFEDYYSMIDWWSEN